MDVDPQNWRLAAQLLRQAPSLFAAPQPEWEALAAGVLADYDACPPWDPDHDQDEICVCGHPYYRHFDSYDGMEPVGCKYDLCMVFKPRQSDPVPAS